SFESFTHRAPPRIHRALNSTVGEFLVSRKAMRLGPVGIQDRDQPAPRRSPGKPPDGDEEAARDDPRQETEALCQSQPDDGDHDGEYRDRAEQVAEHLRGSLAEPFAGVSAANERAQVAPPVP